MPWVVDTQSEPGILHLKLSGAISAEEMSAFADEHNRVIDSLQGRDYRVFCDIADLRPLTDEAARQMERAKAYSASRPNFRGSAVKVASATVSLQHRRTSLESGVLSTELISDDEALLRQHLRTVNRR